MMTNIQFYKSIISEEDHTKVQTLNHTQNVNGNRFYPELVKTPKFSESLSEQETTYYEALELVARIDEDLTHGIRHYRTKSGLLLNTLDEVVQAILDDNLLMPAEKETEMLWVAPQELAA